MVCFIGVSRKVLWKRRTFFFFLVIAFLRYNSHTMQFMCLNYVTASKDTQPRLLLEKFRSKLQWGINSHPSESVQFSHSAVSDSAAPWTAALQDSPSISNSWSLLKLMSIESMMPSNHLILCHPLLILPSLYPSIGVFSNESVLVRMSIIKKCANNKCWRGCGEKGRLLHC